MHAKNNRMLVYHQISLSRSKGVQDSRRITVLISQVTHRFQLPFNRFEALETTQYQYLHLFGLYFYVQEGIMGEVRAHAWGRLSIVDTKPLMLPVHSYGMLFQKQQVKDTQVLPAAAADCRTPRYTR